MQVCRFFLAGILCFSASIHIRVLYILNIFRQAQLVMWTRNAVRRCMMRMTVLIKGVFLHIYYGCMSRLC